MSSPPPQASSRTASLTVAVAGATSTCGARIVHRLQARSATPGSGVGEVIGIAAQPGTHPGVSWRSADIARPAVATALAGVDVLVWVAQETDLQSVLGRRGRERRLRTLRTAQALLMSAAATGVGHLVVVTSAEVYGALADNPVPLPEDAPLRAVGDDGLVGDLLAVEELLTESRDVHPGLRVSVVRPAALVGPGVDTVLTRHFEAPRLLAVRGSTPSWQFCHVEDLSEALVRVAEGGLGPIVTVGASGVLTQAQVERLSGMRRIELSEAAALATAEQLHRVGVLPTPSSELSYVLHPWAVSSATLVAHGWQAAYDNETCLGVLLAEITGRHALAARRLDRMDAALGAASAAVALVGTAAMLRRARRR